MDPVEKHTVSVHFVQSAVRHLKGPAIERALAAADIAPQLLEAHHSRVSAGSYSALWLAVARELDDEFFGLAQRPMRIGSFALLCQAALSCADLGWAIRTALKGFSLLLGNVKGELLSRGDEAILCIVNDIRDAEDRRFADETMLIFVHGLMCWLVGRRIALSQVEFAHPRPGHAREYRRMYCDEILFDASQTCMRFPGGALSLPVVQNAATLRPFLRAAPQSVFLKYRNEGGWTDQVRRGLRKDGADPADWPGVDQLARQLGTTSVTLRRRLETEGTSFQSIKNHLRNDMAINMLLHSSISVDRIGARLGFKETSAFYRAFKRWNGVRPGEYRRRQHGNPE